MGKTDVKYSINIIDNYTSIEFDTIALVTIDGKEPYSSSINIQLIDGAQDMFGFDFPDGNWGTNELTDYFGAAEPLC